MPRTVRTTGRQRRAALDRARGVMQEEPETARAILESLSEEAWDDDPTIAGDASYQLARLSVYRGEALVAIEWIGSARNRYMEAGKTLEALRTDLGLINVLNDLARHREAVDVGERLTARLEDIATTSDEDDEFRRWLLGAAAENTGASMGWLGRHEHALAQHDRAERSYHELDAREDLARVWTNRAADLLELGNDAESLVLARKAASAFATAGDLLSQAHCEVYVARSHVLAGQYGDAIRTLQVAEGRLLGVAPSQDQARISLMWAEVYASLNLFEEARQHCRTLIPMFDKQGLSRHAGQGELVLADVLTKMGSADAAVAALDRAELLFAKIDSDILQAHVRLLRSNLVAPGPALSLAISAFESFLDAEAMKDAVDAAVRCAELSVSEASSSTFLQQAEDIAESGDLRTLSWRADFVRGTWRALAGDLGAANTHFEHALAELRQLRGTIATDHLRAPFMTSRRSVQEAIVRLRLDTGDIDGALLVTEQERSNSLFGVVADARAIAPVDSSIGTIVTFQILGEDVVAFIEREETNHLEVVSLPVGHKEIGTHVRQLESQWRLFGHPELSMHQDRMRRTTDDVLRKLFDGIWSPIAERLDAYEPVTIVPAGSLASLPFSALFDGSTYMIENRELALAPSGRLARLAQPDVTGTTLIVGVPDDRAPGIEAEASLIAESTGGMLLLGDAATAPVLRNEFTNHDVIHIAAHSVYRRDNPWFSALRLADGWIRAIDFAEWSARGSLIVLAACSSGQQGIGGGGDEFLGLPRAFLTAGAAAVVMNLWPSDDETSVALMTSFHRYLRLGSPGAALRTAQLEAMEQSNHPYYWAPPVLYGAHGGRSQ